VTLLANQATLHQDVEGADLDPSAARDLARRNAEAGPLPAFAPCSAIALASDEEIVLAASKHQPIGCPGDTCDMQGAPDRKSILYLSVPGYSADSKIA